MRSLAWLLPLCAGATLAQAAMTRHPGSDAALPDQKYIHVVSESDSPVMQTWIKAKDGLYIAAAVRKPKGNGPFPAIIMFHGAPGGRGMDQLVGSSTGLTTAIDDGITVVDYVQNLPYVKRSDVSVYGVSLGGNLAMYLAARVPTLHAVVAGAPAPIWFLGLRLNADGSRPDFNTAKADPATAKENIEPIKM